MRNTSYHTAAVSMIVIVALTAGLSVQQVSAQPPPIAAPIVREGDFALELSTALNLGNPTSEAEAEDMLGSVGIAPRNGWIADYPVTPDIIGELRDSIEYAAQARTITMDADTALKILQDTQSSVNLLATPSPTWQTYSSGITESNYPEPAEIGDYYSSEGPPIVTYYVPPAAYYGLYAWVPYPFWWGGFWFGGFFALHDFHKVILVNNRTVVCSNHFNAISVHRVFRIDPLSRLTGRTYAGIGAPRSNSFINPGVQKAPERVFNRSTGASGSRTANPFQADRVYRQPQGGARTFSRPPNPGAHDQSSPSHDGGRGSSGGMRK